MGRVTKPAGSTQRRNALMLAAFILINEELLGKDERLSSLIYEGLGFYRSPVYRGEFIRLRNAMIAIFGNIVGEKRDPALGWAFIDSHAQEMCEIVRNPRRRRWWTELQQYTGSRPEIQAAPLELYERAEAFFQHAKEELQKV